MSDLYFSFAFAWPLRPVGRYKKVCLSSKTKSTRLDLRSGFIWDVHVRISIHFLQAVRKICGEMGSSLIYIYIYIYAKIV